MNYFNLQFKVAMKKAGDFDNEQSYKWQTAIHNELVTRYTRSRNIKNMIMAK